MHSNLSPQIKESPERILFLSLFYISFYIYRTLTLNPYTQHSSGTIRYLPKADSPNPAVVRHPITVRPRPPHDNPRNPGSGWLDLQRSEKPVQQLVIVFHHQLEVQVVSSKELCYELCYFCILQYVFFYQSNALDSD